MFYKRVSFTDESNNLFIYKLPDNLTSEQIDFFFYDYLKLKGKWSDVNEVKIHRELSIAKYNTLFAPISVIEDINIIKEYFNTYRVKEAVFVQMKAFACKYLYKKGMIMADIAEVMGYKTHTSVIYMINDYKPFTKSIKFEDFIDIIKDKEYPTFKNGKLEFIKL